MTQAAEPCVREPLSADESMPPPAVSPATAHVIAMSDLDHPHPRGGEPQTNGVQKLAAPLVSVLADVHSPLRHVKAKLTVCVGSAELTIGELLGASEQQVVRLDRAVEQPVDVMLEGHVVARGTLVAVDEHFAVRITELPSPLGGARHTARAP